MAIVRTLSATTPEELKQVGGSVHDAYFDHEQVMFDEATRTVTVPFAQEGGQWLERSGIAIPEPELLRRTWRYEEYRVPFLRCELVVHAAQSVNLGPKTALLDPGMLDHIEYDSGAAQILIRTVTGPQIMVRADSVRVEVQITDDVVLHVRRKRGRFGVVSDRLDGVWIGDA